MQTVVLPEALVNPQSCECHSSIMEHFVGSHQTLKHLNTAQTVSGQLVSGQR